MSDRLGEFDAFLSYASEDRRPVVRLHRFLQSFRGQHSQRPLRVFLDTHDFRAGPISHELDQALARSRHLVVCCSPAAARSNWVDHEIATFLRSNPPSAILLLNLQTTAIESVPDRIKPLNIKVQDLTKGLGPGPIRNPARDELLRAISFIARVDLRDVVDWSRRRLVLQGSAIAVASTATALSTYWYVERQRQVRVSDLSATVTFALADDPGLGGGERLATWHVQNCVLALGIYSTAPTDQASWAWTSRKFPLHAAAIRLQSLRQSVNSRTNQNAAGTWIESVRTFDAFAGDLGTMRNATVWKLIAIEARLSAFESQRNIGHVEPSSKSLERFKQTYSVTVGQLEKIEEHDGGIRPLPIVATLAVHLSGETIYLGRGIPAHVREGDEDARRLHITHFPLASRA